MSSSIEQIFDKLRLSVGSRLTPEHEQEMRRAGYDRDAICDIEGPDAERFHDALFSTESIAQAVIGSNLVRIGYSMKACTEIVAACRPEKVADIGGACGLVCFDAAVKFPDSQFTIIDRSDNALSVGRKWAQFLGLRNVVFVRQDFSQIHFSLEIGRDHDLALLEYVLDMCPACDDEDSVVIQMMPAIAIATWLLRPAGTLRVRFGDFDESGLTGLIRSAFRSGLAVGSVEVTAHGHALLFGKGTRGERCENEEVASAMDDFSCQFRELIDPSPE